MKTSVSKYEVLKPPHCTNKPNITTKHRHARSQAGQGACPTHLRADHCAPISLSINDVYKKHHKLQVKDVVPLIKLVLSLQLRFLDTDLPIMIIKCCIRRTKSQRLRHHMIWM